MINLADGINIILQSLMLILIPNFCTNYKNSKLKLLFLTGLFCFIVTITTYIIGNSSLGTIIIHVVLILTGIFVFRKDSLGATIAISIVYLCIIINTLINTLIMSNLFLGYFQYKIPTEYFEMGYIIFIYLPHYLMDIVILLRKDLIYKIYLLIRSKNISIMTLIITTVMADFIISFNFIMHDLDNPVFKNVMFMLMGLFIIGITFYFANIDKKSKEVSLLNKELQEKINDLKKVKHDYGAQISYLYGMHLMGKHDRLGESLKSIINGYDNIISEINISNNDSIISMVVNGINHKGINILVDDQVSLEDIGMSEMEIQRVVSNILRNSITAMDEKGLISIRTYYGINNIFIKIQNNGPKIDDGIIDKIFEVGFTTKDNKYKEHGFGLDIVKEIVERHNGKVIVSSNESITEFIVKIPRKLT